MSYTFGDQLNKLASLLGDPNTSTDDQWPLADRKKEINRGELKFVTDTHILREYDTGTIASGELSVPPDWLETHVLIIDNKVITNDQEIALSQWEYYYNAGGNPPYYYFWEFSGTRKMKFLGSINGKTYYLYYFKKPTTELSDTTDTSSIPEEYREASVYYAAGELMDQIGKHEIANVHRDSYAQLAQKAMIDVEKQVRVENAIPRPDLGDIDEYTGVDRQGVSY